jgi:hypothetical protein
MDNWDDLGSIPEKGKILNFQISTSKKKNENENQITL